MFRWNDTKKIHDRIWWSELKKWISRAPAHDYAMRCIYDLVNCAIQFDECHFSAVRCHFWVASGHTRMCTFDEALNGTNPFSSKKKKLIERKYHYHVERRPIYGIIFAFNSLIFFIIFIISEFRLQFLCAEKFTPQSYSLTQCKTEKIFLCVFRSFWTIHKGQDAR